MERLMTTVPNFAPRGVGFRFTEAQIFITATAATPTEILTATMRQIRCPPFRKRFNEYIESEENPMTYINEKHRTRFTLAAKNVHRENYALLSALYLLTADQRLWSCCKHHINNGCVFFENIKLHNCTERAYTFYCAAKDLALGTKHITVSDLADADLVPPMLGKLYLRGEDVPKQITLSRQSIRWKRFDLCRSKTALFSLLWGKKCGFYAKPRKKQLRNRRIYAII